MGHCVAPDIVLVQGNLVGSFWLKRSLCIEGNSIVARVVYKGRNRRLKVIESRSSISCAPEVSLYAQVLARLPKEHFSIHHIESKAQSEVVVVCEVYLKVKIVVVSLINN